MSQCTPWYIILANLAVPASVIIAALTFVWGIHAWRREFIGSSVGTGPWIFLVQAMAIASWQGFLTTILVDKL